MIKRQFTIIKETGFARPATLLVSIAHRFTSDIFLEYQGKTVNLKQAPKAIMDIMDLGIKPGTEIHIYAHGADEAKAIQKMKEHLLKTIIYSNFKIYRSSGIVIVNLFCGKTAFQIMRSFFFW